MVELWPLIKISFISGYQYFASERTWQSEDGRFINNYPVAPKLVIINRIYGFKMLKQLKFFWCLACSSPGPLGMADGSIKNDQITASSRFLGYDPWEGRLYNDNNWSASTPSPSNPWIQVDLLSINILTKIRTQGNPNLNHWVTELQILTGESLGLLSYIMNGNTPMVRHIELKLTEKKIPICREW